MRYKLLASYGGSLGSIAGLAKRMGVVQSKQPFFCDSGGWNPVLQDFKAFIEHEGALPRQIWFVSLALGHFCS